jgi:hypothetical protein
MNTTTLRKIISEIDLTDNKLRTTPNWEELGSLFEIYDSIWTDEERLKSYFIKKWYCTDSYVGTRAYFFDGKFIAISTQVGRKADEEFIFTSKEDAFILKNYLESLVSKDKSFNIDYFDDELDVVISTTFKIEYNSQILHKSAFLNGEKVKIIKTNFGSYSKENTKDYFHSVIVEKENGEQIKIDCRELDFEYNV